MRSILIFVLTALALVGAAVSSCWAQLPMEAVDDVEQRNATIISEGVRMSADIYVRKSSAGQPLPTIIMSHGWGGTAKLLAVQAVTFARAGYFVVAFDYRGWGESDSRVILTGAAPDRAQRDGTRFTAQVQEVLEVMDPIEQATDIFNVIHWAMGEPQVDRNRIGLWGTSFSGGLVVYVAARDPRVRAIVSQVGYFGVPVGSMPAPMRARSYEDATRRARGEIGYPPPGAREVGNLRGGPVREKFLVYAPIEDVARAQNCAMLFIAAQNEELFDNREHPELAWKRASEPKRYVVIPGIPHYAIYGQAREEATRLALEWFDAHLKP
jgi:dienelactone hydrolase